MKTMRFYLLFSISLVLVFSNLFNIGAQAPKRAKIVFASTRNGNHGNAEIYVMNTDGSQQIRLTHYPRDDTIRRGHQTANTSLLSQIEITKDFPTSISWMPMEKTSAERLMT